MVDVTVLKVDFDGAIINLPFSDGITEIRSEDSQKKTTESTEFGESETSSVTESDSESIAPDASSTGVAVAIVGGIVGLLVLVLLVKKFRGGDDIDETDGIDKV